MTFCPYKREKRTTNLQKKKKDKDMEGIKFPTYKFLKNFKMKCGEQGIRGRITRLWEVRNLKIGYEIISLIFLTIGWKSNVFNIFTENTYN